MVVLIHKFSYFSHFKNLLKLPKISICSNRNGHISASDKARTFDGSSPKISDCTLSLGSISFTV